MCTCVCGQSWSQVLLWLLSVYWGRVSFLNSNVTSQLAWQASLLRGSAVCRLRTGITGDCHHGQHLCGFWGPRLTLVPTLTPQVLYPLNPLPSSTPTPRSFFKEKVAGGEAICKIPSECPHLKLRPSSVIFNVVFFSHGLASFIYFLGDN